MAFRMICMLTVCLIGTIRAMAEPVRAEQMPEGFQKRGAGGKLTNSKHINQNQPSYDLAGYDYDYYNPNYMYYQK